MPQTNSSFSGADPGLFKGGSGGAHYSRLQAKKGGSRRGSNFKPNVKMPTTCAKKGGPAPLPLLDPPMLLAMRIEIYVTVMVWVVTRTLTSLMMVECQPVIFMSP